MFSELSGLLLTSGIVLAASTFVASNAPEVESIDEGNKAFARDAFNKAHQALVSSTKKDKIFLAPSFGGSYTDLGDALKKAGISLTASVNEQSAIIDLQKLMKGSPSFSAERKIQLALVEEGILLLPGEAFGAEQPGQFRITAPHLNKDEIALVVDKLYKVAHKFNVTLSKRPATVSVEDVNDNDDEDSVVSSVAGKPESTRKKRKN